MALNTADRAVIEAWTGSIDPLDEEELDKLSVHFGSIYVVALHLLLKQRADFTAKPTELAASGDRVSRSANLKAVDGQIAALVGAITGNDRIRLTQDGEDLVDAASGGVPSYTRTVPLRADNRRRGG